MKIVLGDPDTELTWGLLKRWAEISNVSDEMKVTALVPALLGNQIIQKMIALNDLMIVRTDSGELILVFGGS